MRAQAATSSPAVTTAARPKLLVVVDPTVCLDEPHDPRLVERVERVDARPRGQGDPALHRRVRGQDHLAVVPPHDLAELVNQPRALTVLLDLTAAACEGYNPAGR